MLDAFLSSNTLVFSFTRFLIVISVLDSTFFRALSSVSAAQRLSLSSGYGLVLCSVISNPKMKRQLT